MPLLYPGRWHFMGGLTTAGKSLFAAMQAVAVMDEGGLVAYFHFEESRPGGTLERLRRLSPRLDIGTLEKQFAWPDCERKWSLGEVAEHLALAAGGKPALIVLDGVNACVSRHGGNIDRTESVGMYRELFVAPAVATGAAVLSLGHPVKDRTRQDERHSFGSTAWLDEVDGVAFRLEASASGPIGRGRKGASALYCVKDRYGEVERHGQQQPGREAGWSYLGQFVVDDSSPSDSTDAYLVAPKPGVPSVAPAVSREASDDDQVFSVVQALLAAGREANGRTTRAGASGLGKDRVDSALVRLVCDGLLTEGVGPRNARVFDLPSAAGDQL